MSQLFRDDEACKYFFEIIKLTKQQNYINNLVKMSREATSSKAFGYVLYDSKAFPQLSNLSRDFFASNYQAILDAMARAGVFDSYILLVKQIMGESTKIYHEIPNSGHLVIKIAKTESNFQKLATNDELQLATSGALGILATIPISDFTITQLKKTIEALCQPAGIYVDLRTIYPKSITVTPTSASINVGDTVTFSAEVVFDDGTTDTNVMWESSDVNIASVSSSGVATGLRFGLVDITASAIGIDSFKTSVPLRVNDTSLGYGYVAGVMRTRKSVIIKGKE